VAEEVMEVQEEADFNEFLSLGPFCSGPLLEPK